MKEFDKKLAAMIDHTILKPEATPEDIIQICKEAVQYGFASVCIYPKFLLLAKEHLAGNSVKPIAVIDFPEGKGTPELKAKEAKAAVESGAMEIDMVIDKAALKSKDYKKTYEGICQVVLAAGNVPVKVIIEAGELDHDEKIAACVLSKLAGAAFVKTSTGFGKGGATTEDIALMRKTVGPELGVKASGGVRTREDAEAMVNAGATRIGASASIAIVTSK
jgi:deoxyribose-phosphate aldolase